MAKYLLFLLIPFVSFSQITPDEKLIELKIELPEVSKPIANYVSVVQTGNLLFLAGKGPSLPDGTYISGKIGNDLTIKEGYDAARLTGLHQLAVLKNYLGSLNKVKRIVKVLGMVNAKDNFTSHSSIINGFSDLMVEIFGESGKHARSSVGMSSLPSNMAVEIELIVELYPD